MILKFLAIWCHHIKITDYIYWFPQDATQIFGAVIYNNVQIYLMKSHWLLISVLFFSFPYLKKIRFFFKDFIYSRETQKERQRHRQSKKQAPCRKPDAGLDLSLWGDHALNQRQTDAQLLSHPGIPLVVHFKWIACIVCELHILYKLST